MKKIILTIIYILTLSGCGLEQGSYLVRWWNGNIPTKLSDKKEKVRFNFYAFDKTLQNLTAL